jgi:hypothetical protein
MFGFKKTDYVAQLVNGPKGQQVLRSVGTLADHFKALDGWDVERLSVPELTYLAAFNAWVTIRADRARFSLTSREATEAAYGLIQALSRWYGEIKHLASGEVRALEKRGGERLLEYDALWDSGSESGDHGAFLLHTYHCVQVAPDLDLGAGFIDHLTSFGVTASKLAGELREAA